MLELLGSMLQANFGGRILGVRSRGLLMGLGIAILTGATAWNELHAQPPSAGRPRPGAARPGFGQPAKTTAPPQRATVTPEPPRPPQTLPPGYQPPSTPPDIMTEWTELLSEAQREDFKKIRNKYSSVLRNGGTNAAEREILSQGLRYRVQILSMKDQLRELHDRRMELVAQDLQQAGRIMKADEVRAFRRSVLEQVVKYTEPLLTGNFYTRIQAVTLLGELDLITEDSTRNLKHETFPPAVEPLLRVLTDPNQPVAVKIPAARSIVRLVKYGDVPVELRHRIATAVLSELAIPDTHYWYQMRLAEILSALDVTVDLQNRKPFVVNGLAAVIRDSKRDLRVRCEAAKALGRVPFDRDVDVSALNRDLMQLAIDLTTAAQEQPTASHWKQCFFDLYLAYKPIDGSDKEATKKSPAGLLNNPQAATAAQQTYHLVLPLVNAVLNDRPIAVPDVQALQAWVQSNAPVAGAGGNAPAGTRTAQPAAVQSTNATAPK